MSHSSRAFHRHACVVLDQELQRARGPLRSLAPDRRRIVEELVADVATAVVDGVLDEARREPALAAALVSIYGMDTGRELTAAPRVAD